MSTTTTITRTRIDLEELSNGQAEVNRPSGTDSSINVDDVAEASRVVDAGVPEGGYGWVALAGCGAICFWVSLWHISHLRNTDVVDDGRVRHIQLIS